MRSRALVGLYPTAVTVAGAMATGGALWQLTRVPPDWSFYLLAGFTILSGWATLRIPDIPTAFSISDCFTMTTAVLFGPSAGAALVAVDALVISLRLARRQLTAQQVLFNATTPALAMWLAAHLFFYLSGAGPGAPVSWVRIVGPLAVFAATYFVLNTGFVATAVACAQGLNPFHVWRQHFLSLWLTYFGGAAFAALMVALLQSNHDMTVVALVAPIPFVLYATFRNAVGRMQDRVGHLQDVNRLHLATIETLAHAIDAKDQVTHWHIRRVQRMAMQLARALGVTDESQLRAIEAASLLHDIGKIAVPERILGKPSGLTPAEFETMKAHASIGADILESVGFPFPAVPIVRHHHENWDGTGYPSGLMGDAIPLGARILSVVDCYDALTSDRPYRRRLPVEEALHVLQERRGTQYDPHIVDTFKTIHQEVEPEDAHVTALERPPTPRLEPPHPQSEDVPTALALAALIDIGTELGTSGDALAVIRRIHVVLQRVLPVATTVVYTHDARTDSLVATWTAGLHGEVLRGASMPVGQGLSGWVCLNRQPIVNRDATLDLTHLATTLHPMPQSCASAPIGIGKHVHGVLTLYSHQAQSFSEEDAAIVESVASRLSAVVQTHGRTRSQERRGSPSRAQRAFARRKRPITHA